MIVLFPFYVITYEDYRRVGVLYDPVCIIQINFLYRTRDAGFSFINSSWRNDIIITFDVIKIDRTS